MDPMRKYESVFIFPPEEGPEALKNQEKRLEELIPRFGGRILDRQDQGRRPLGYAVKKNKEGRLLILHFEMEPRQVNEMRKAIELDEAILKATLVFLPEPKPVKESAKKARRRERKKEEAAHARQP